MRTFEERRAEILLRSETKIRIRKTIRTRLLMCCIPFCISIAVLSYMYFSGVVISNNDTSSSTSDGAGMIGGIENGNDFDYKSVKIKITPVSSDNYILNSDLTQVEYIYNAIQSCFDLPPKTQNNQTTGGSSEENHSNNGTDVLSYEIIFVSDNKTQETYTLKRNVLTNLNTMHRITLSADQISDLQKAFETVIIEDNPDVLSN